MPHTNQPLPTVLILGATGSFGGAIAGALLARGWQVRALTRKLEAAQDAGLPGVQWVQGDAMNASDVFRATQGVQFIVHGVNPPNYKRWRELALPMLDHTIAAARTSGARVILPGNVYNFGPDAGALLSEDSPQHPVTGKGRVRVEMEQRLQAASAQGVRSLVIRMGDFFGARGHSSWFEHLWIKPGRRLSRLSYPGRHDVGHAWAYLPDAAQALAKLMAIEITAPDRLQAFEVFHFGGHWLPRGAAMPEAVARAVGQPGLPIRGFPWAVIRLASPFVTFLRELLEMRYLWQVPVQLDNRKLVAFLGRESHTPLDQAVRASLKVRQGMDINATPQLSH